jgi:hypothetical protein
VRRARASTFMRNDRPLRGTSVGVRNFRASCVSFFWHAGCHAWGVR